MSIICNFTAFFFFTESTIFGIVKPKFTTGNEM